MGGLVSLKFWTVCTSQRDTYVHSGAFEEEGGLVGDEVAGEVLRGVHQASDSCASEVGSLEQVKQGRSAAQLSLDLDCALNHGELLSVVL